VSSWEVAVMMLCLLAAAALLSLTELFQTPEVSDANA
jgi:hypothetical protein